MRTVFSESQAIINYVPTTSMEWGELWAEQIADGRFHDALTGDIPSTEWKTALWCLTYMEAVAVKQAITKFYGAELPIICTDEVEGFVVLMMEKDVR